MNPFPILDLSSLLFLHEESFMNKTPIVLDAQYSAGIWIENDADEVLLQLRSSNETSFPGKWCLPGGRVPKGMGARSVIIHRLMHELGLGTVNVPSEPFRKDWVADGYGNYASYTLFAPHFTMEMSDFMQRDHFMVPSVAFYNKQQLLDLAKEDALHPATAYAVRQLAADDMLPLNRVLDRD